MSFMNLNIGLLIYEDQSATAPKIRTPDLTCEYQKLAVNRPKSDEHFLAAGETATIAATARTTGIDGTTEFEILRPRACEDIIRMRWVGGAAPGFRARRLLSVDATTEITITRVAPNTVRFESTGGTPMNTAGVVVGDLLKLERSTDDFTSVFNLVNHGFWQVQAKGAGYIDVLDNGSIVLEADIVLGPDFDMQMRVMSAGNVRVGDTLQLSGNINTGNQDKYSIIDLSTDYVEFVNPYAVGETFTVDGNVAIYDRLISFLFVRGSGSFILKINGDTDGVRYSPMCGEAVFLGSVEAHTVEASNDGSETIRLMLQQASFM